MNSCQWSDSGLPGPLVLDIVSTVSDFLPANNSQPLHVYKVHRSQLRCIVHRSIPCIYKGDNFCDSMFTFQYTQPFRKCGLLLKKRICFSVTDPNWQGSQKHLWLSCFPSKCFHSTSVMTILFTVLIILNHAQKMRTCDTILCHYTDFNIISKYFN